MKTAHRKASRAKRHYTADPMAMFRTLGRVQPFTESEQTQLNLPVRLAYDSMLRGKAVKGDFQTLAAAVNIAMICAERIDPLVEQSCIAAQDALMRVRARFDKLGSWGLDGPAIGEIEQAVDIYEQLTSLLTGGQLKSAMTECVRRMAAGDVLTCGLS